jgi:hypothetical protein
MKRIKSYDEFQNEEINWKNIVTGAALSSSLLLSPVGAKATTQNPNTIELSQIQNANILFTKKITVSGTKDEVVKKVVQKLRENKATIYPVTKEKLNASFTLTDVKPDNSNGITNVTIEVNINGNDVEFNFKKVDFIYTGIQPTTPTQQLGRQLKNTGLDILTATTRRVVKNPVISGRVGAELQKNKSHYYDRPENFNWSEANSSNKVSHKTFIKNLNLKIDSILKSI